VRPAVSAHILAYAPCQLARIVLHSIFSGRDVKFAQHFQRAFHTALLGGILIDLMDSHTWFPMKKTEFSEVIGSWIIRAILLPRTLPISASQSFSRPSQSRIILAPPHNTPLLRGYQADKRQHRNRHARAGLADYPQRLPFSQRKADPVNRFDGTLTGLKIGAEIRNSQDNVVVFV
jgi:hypothetical protein